MNLKKVVASKEQTHNHKHHHDHRHVPPTDM